MCVRDAANGMEIAQQLVGKVSRKVVKQTVMTLVYGVTFIGGRRQISGQLDDLGLSPSVVWKGSSYLTRNVFASIREMFYAAKDIQVRCSACISLFPMAIINSRYWNGSYISERIEFMTFKAMYQEIQRLTR